jgi:hypothetical protein
VLGPRGAVGQRLCVGSQPDDDRVLVEQVAPVRIEDRPGGSADETRRRLNEPHAQRGRLRLAKLGLALGSQ